jgi:cytosine/adenosine deaminase-related metal-dependent hydrolase
MLLTAERVIVNGRARAGVGVVVNRDGRITAVRPLAVEDRPDRVLAGRLLVPGFVNAHAEVWQRLAVLVTGDPAGIGVAGARVLERLQPEDLFHAARLAFAEMLLDGVTTVSVMHGLHHQPDGTPYGDPPALAEAVMQGAREAGVRLCLVRAIRIRERGAVLSSPAERRSSDASVEDAADDLLRMAQRLLTSGDGRLGWGLGAQSPTSVPLHSLIALKTRFAHAPFHLPLCDAPQEAVGQGASRRQGTLDSFATANLVDSCTVLSVDAELSERERDWAALLGPSICVVPADSAGPQADCRLLRGLPVCLGSGTRASLRAVARSVGASTRIEGKPADLAAQRVHGDALFAALTRGGAAATHADAGAIAPGRWADFATFDLNDRTFANAEDAELAARLASGGAALLPREVAVAGHWVVEDGVHPGLAAARKAAEGSAARLAAN